MDVYDRLAGHLSALGMGYPVRNELVQILKEVFTEEEAEALLAIPNTTVPLRPVGLDEIGKSCSLERSRLSAILEGLSRKGLVFSGPDSGGETGYALHQVGFGFPQTFFWKGEESEQARKMARMIRRYFTTRVTEEAYSPSSTKPYRYIPVRRTLDIKMQAVFPFHLMETVVAKARTFAVAHCPCRMIYGLNGGKCGHPLEVCIKFDEMADYVIARGLARQVSGEEALEIIRRSEEAGLVHFVDNTEDGIQHNCNCCGCACWNVGHIRRRRVPRDTLMATYFIRETDKEACTGCGACVDICPVAAVKMIDETVVVDTGWCIGCGVCGTVCPTGAACLVLRPDRSRLLPARDFEELHTRIQKEKGR
jgi:NAD-dependent dihydropyrimidine dehydrogenase PreA subunit